MRQVLASLRDAGDTGIAAEEVAEAIHAALTTDSPPARVLLGLSGPVLQMRIKR